MLLQLLFSFIPISLAHEYSISSNHIGQVFDGIGVINGAGTSKLLFDSLSDREIEEIFSIFFSPSNGLNILKVEMAGDEQSTDATEGSHRREKNKMNFHRGYQWKTMKIAKKVNPFLKICVLPWTFPGWISNFTQDPFEIEEQMADYVVSWIEGAQRIHSIDIDCVGIWNERKWTESYVKILKRQLQEKNLDKVRIVVGDNFQTSKEDFQRMLNDEFRDEFDIIGVHYPGGILPENVRHSDKILWSTEDYSTFDDTGYGCMARTLNHNYVKGNMTGTIIWHLISAFYSSMPYYGASLSTFNQSSSLNILHPFKAVLMTTMFVRPGWRILQHNHGSGLLKYGGSYVSYTSNNQKDLSITIETMSWNNSLCFYSNPPYYQVKSKQFITFRLQENFRQILKMNFYCNGITQTIPVQRGGILKIKMPLDSLCVLSTLLKNPWEKDLPIIRTKQWKKEEKYEDDFETYIPFSEPRYLFAQKGSWEVHNGIAIQMINTTPISWCNGDISSPIAIIPGSSLSISIRLPYDSPAFPLYLALRTNCSGCLLSSCNGIFVSFSPCNTDGFVFTSLKNPKPIAKFKLPESWDWNEWKTFGIENDEQMGNLIFTMGGYRVLIDVSSHKFESHEFVAIGSMKFGISYWDNLVIYH